MAITTARFSGITSGTKFANFEANNSSALVPIAWTQLGANTATVTFSEIPATFQDLRVVAFTRYAIGENNTYVRFNNDSATNYSGTAIYGNGTSALSFRESNATGFQVGRSPDATGVFNTITFDILNYANTSTNKTVLSSCAMDENGSGFVYRLVNLWRSTSAINRIDFYFPGFDSGSTFALYGVRAA